MPKEALISQLRLSQGKIEQVTSLAEELGISFHRAAIELGFINEDEIPRAQETALQPESSEGIGPIEAAIRKLAGGPRRRKINASTRFCVLGSHLVLVNDPYHEDSEKLRALRTELMLLMQQDGQSCVMSISSAFAGEGRSQLAAELAVAFAQLGRNTLLVDADMRNPRQHVIFEGCGDEDGLAHALISSSHPQVLGVKDLPNLYVLPTGQTPPNPLELLSTHHFRRLVSDWRSSFDFVIIDTPAIGKFADGLAVATVAERALIACRAKHTTYRGFKDMLRRLAMAETRVMGAVMNYF
jgi:protein-tyrosine kinase